MPQIDRAYMALALAMLIAGELLGFYMGMKADNYSRSVHVGIVLIGFVTIAIYAAIFRLWPTMKHGVLARVQFWLTFVGLTGLTLRSVHGNPRWGDLIRVLRRRFSQITRVLLLKNTAMQFAGDPILDKAFNDARSAFAIAAESIQFIQVGEHHRTKSDHSYNGIFSIGPFRGMWSQYQTKRNKHTRPPAGRAGGRV
jgi:hypothetical protein